MDNGNKKRRNSAEILKKIFSAVVLILLGAATLAFGILYVEVTDIAFFNKHKILVETLLSLLVTIFTVIAVVFGLYDKKFVYKITAVLLGTFAVVLLVLYAVKVSGLWDKIGSIEGLRSYVASYGRFTVPIFIAIQFLQVVVLPIPSMVTIGAGVALFGPFYGALYSLIGILSASIIAFFIGRYLGYKVVSWIIGEKSLQKGLQLVKGKDTIVLTFMFLFPFFPDDVLCFVAGLSTMSVKFYLIMITVTRIIGIVLSSYSLGGKIIPFDTWWGITLWICIFVITCVLCVIIYKNGETIEKKIRGFFKRKNADGKSDSTHRS